MVGFHNHDDLLIAVDLSLPAGCVCWELGQVIKWRSKPEAINYGSGPNPTSRVFKTRRESVASELSASNLGQVATERRMGTRKSPNCGTGIIS